MLILLTKDNCEKCHYVSDNADMTHVIEWNMNKDTEWGGHLHTNPIANTVHADIDIIIAVEVLTVLAFNEAKIREVGAKIMPLLMDMDGKILAEGAGRCIRVLGRQDD